MTLDAQEINRLIGQRTRQFRLRRRLSQEQLAEGLGVTFQQVQKYEKGANRISAGRLAVIARILDVPISSFYADLPDIDSGTSLPDLEQAAVETAISLGALPANMRVHLRGLIASLAEVRP